MTMPSKNRNLLRRHKKSVLAAATAAFGIFSVAGKRNNSRSTMAAPSRQGSITNRGAGGATTTQPLPPSPSDQISANILAPSITSPSAPRQCNFSCLDTTGWNKVCGTDGVTYLSTCDLEETVCEQQRAHRPEITKLRHDGPCLDDVAEYDEIKEEENSNQFFSPLSCEFSCLDADNGGGVGIEFASLCGTDGNTYPSICLLEQQACRAKKTGKPEILVDYTGVCEQGDMISSHDDTTTASPVAPFQLRRKENDILYFV